MHRTKNPSYFREPWGWVCWQGAWPSCFRAICLDGMVDHLLLGLVSEKLSMLSWTRSTKVPKLNLTPLKFPINIFTNNYIFSRWIAWSPFVGMFLANISRGRTIREFITGTLTIPSMYTFLWFTIFGGTTLSNFPVHYYLIFLFFALPLVHTYLWHYMFRYFFHGNLFNIGRQWSNNGA